MSFVTARPEALAAAASHMQAIGSALSAQDAASAGPTTGVAPAAADGISALTAAQFAAHGSQYQQVAAQAAAIHEKFVTAMNTAAESYAATESANAASASSASSPLASTLSLLGSNALFTDLGGGASTALMYIPSSLAPSMIGFLTAAGSTVGGGASGGIGGLLLPGGPLSALGGLGGGVSGAAGAASAAAGTISATTPAVSASMGQATLVGSLSAPSGWGVTSTAGTAAATPMLQGSGWTAAPESQSMAAMPPAIPGGGGRGGFGFGTPRYGVKPTVMPRPVMVG